MLILLFFLVFTQILVITAKDKSVFPVKSILLLSACVFILTELLSFADVLNINSIRISWAIVFLGLLYPSYSSFKNFKYKGISLNQLSRFQVFCFSYVTFYLLVILFICLSSTPYDWDSFAYHLPRVFHWLQNGNIEHFATSNTRQISMPPLAEYFEMHFYSLANHYVGFNLVNWFIAFASIFVVNAIGKDWNLNENERAFTILFATSIPMFILQSSSTQNDIFASFYFLCSFLFVFRIIKEITIENAVFLGLSIGFAVFSKGTNYIYLIPLAFVILWNFFPVLLKKNTLKASSIVLGLLIVINVSYWKRNLETFEKPFGPASFFVGEPSLGSALSNTMKNASQHLHINPDFLNHEITHFEELNYVHYKSIIWIHDALGLELNNSNNIWSISNWSDSIFVINDSNSEYFEGSPFHALFFLIALIFSAFLYIKRKELNKEFLAFALIGVINFILFSVLLKWQIWHNRQFISVSILLGFAIVFVFRKQKLWLWVLASILALQAINPLLNSHKRTFIKSKDNFYLNKDKIQQVFTAEKHARADFKEIIELVDYLNISKIGLRTPYDAWEYPLWQFIANDTIEIFHVDVQNRSNQYSDDRVADLVISFRKDNPVQLNLENIDYDIVATSSYAKLYLKSDHPFNYKIYDESEVSDFDRLSSLNELLKEYYQNYNAYPKSKEFAGLYCDLCPMTFNKFWIRELIPVYTDKIPRSRNNSTQGSMHFKYKSDGIDYKLVAHNPEDLDSIQSKNPLLLDPIREKYAYGFWTEGAEKW